MKIVAMIPARYASTRFPGKLMSDLGGKSVIVRTYQATLETRLFDEVYVVTDSDLIEKEVKINDGKVIKSRAKHECGTDRITEALMDLNLDVEIIVNVQGDAFVNKLVLEKMIEVFSKDKSKEIDVVSLMQDFKNSKDIENPNFVKVVVDREDHALFFSRTPIPHSTDENNIESLCFEHVGIYAFRKLALLDFYRLPASHLERFEKVECLRFLEHGRKIKMIKIDFMGIEIDTPEDLKNAQLYFE